ncbi:hypothetical protein ACFQ5F_09855 [Kroppenstedtia eburnea]|uniref:hypothetical protein n=1 Tax=Kroppenstedtia eburnea TaxID=714067 RepID=UPI0036392168
MTNSKQRYKVENMERVEYLPFEGVINRLKVCFRKQWITAGDEVYRIELYSRDAVEALRKAVFEGNRMIAVYPTKKDAMRSFDCSAQITLVAGA